MLEREMNNLTNEELCDIMCSNVEYDDDDFYVYNCNHEKNLWEYEGIEKENVFAETYLQEVYRIEELETYDWFDWSDVAEQFTIIKIKTMQELLDFMSKLDENIIIERPNRWKSCPNLTQIKIYDGWNE